MYRMSLLSHSSVLFHVDMWRNFWGTLRQNPVTSGEQIREPPITTEDVFNLGAHLPFCPVILTILATVQYFSFFGGGFLAQQPPPVGQGLPIHEISRSHSDSPQSLGLLWTNDQLVAETSTWHHTTLTKTNIHAPRWDSNPRSQQESGRRPTP